VSRRHRSGIVCLGATNFDEDSAHVVIKPGPIRATVSVGFSDSRRRLHDQDYWRKRNSRLSLQGKKSVVRAHYRQAVAEPTRLRETPAK
jgi:hypothetical protein